AYDGRPLAGSLAEAGVEIDYSNDMGLFAKLREADLVVLGADAVFPLYFLNKIGTHALAELAQVRNVPCFALCTASKFLPTAAAGLLVTKSGRPPHRASACTTIISKRFLYRCWTASSAIKVGIRRKLSAACSMNGRCRRRCCA